jgi:hypothetical protein
MQLISGITVYCKRYKHQLSLALLTMGMAAVIEWRHNYYFLKTDNLDQNLPYYIHNLRSLLSGEFPLFNFHQYLGTPIFACIQSAALYPPNYIALFLSSTISGHYYGAIEIVAIFHLIVAAIGFFQLMRFWRLSNVSCFFGAVAWVFCGFVMRVGDGWIQVIEYAAYFPWILLYSLRLTEAFKFRSFFILTMLRTLALFVGNPPFFLYVVTFDLLFMVIYYVLILRKNETGTETVSGVQSGQYGLKSLCLRHGASYISVALLSLPLLLPAMHQIAQSADRNNPLTWEKYSQGGFNALYWMKGLLIPFSKQQYLSIGQNLFFAHIGWLTIFFAIVALWRGGSHRKLVVTFLVLAVFSLLWANNTFITKLIYYLPLYNRQRFPFKLLFFANFFTIALATVGYDYVYRKVIRKYHRADLLCCLILLIHVGNLLAFVIYTPHDTRKVKQVPYDEVLKNKLSDGRIVTIVDKNTADQDKQIYLLGYNFATVFGLNHFAGYETLVAKVNLTAALDRNSSADFYVDNNYFAPSTADLEYFRAWGVKWYILEKKVKTKQDSILKPVHSDNNRLVLYDEAARPMVYWKDAILSTEVVYSFSTNAASMLTDRANFGQLVVNVLYNKFFTATIDGRKTELFKTDDDQMLINVPSGKRSVRIVYSDPYFITGLYISCGFIISILAWLAIKSWNRDRLLHQNDSVAR